MQIYVSHLRNSDYESELYEPIKSSDFYLMHNFIFPHNTNERIDSRKIFEKKECDLILAEVSSPSTGQGIELGFAKMLGVPIVCIYQKGADIAGSLKAVSSDFIEYVDSEDMINKLERYLNEKTNN